MEFRTPWPLPAALGRPAAAANRECLFGQADKIAKGMQPGGNTVKGPPHAKAGGAAGAPGPVAKGVSVGPIAVPSSHHHHHRSATQHSSKTPSPEEVPPGSAGSSKPAYTVAEVLRKTKSLLQPKSAIEHQVCARWLGPPRGNLQSAGGTGSGASCSAAESYKPVGAEDVGCAETSPIQAQRRM